MASRLPRELANLARACSGHASTGSPSANLIASSNPFQVYDSDTVHFYLDGSRTTDEADSGDIVPRNTDVFIGQARLDEGISSYYPPSSRLYGESLWEQQMKVTNDRRPSSNR